VYGWVLHSDGINYFDVKPMFCGLLLSNCFNCQFNAEHMSGRLLLLGWPIVKHPKFMPSQHILAWWLGCNYKCSVRRVFGGHLNGGYDRTVIMRITTGCSLGSNGSS